MICPVCHQSVRRPEFKVHIKQCLHEEYLKEPLTASVQMIHTLAVNEEKKKLCVDTLCRYLDNIITNPNEEKFRKIRANNKGFKERIECVTGGVLFLEAIGFIKELLPHQDNEEYFYVLPESKASCIDELIVWKEVLTSAETLKPHLDRNPQLLRPSGQVNKFELPDEFFNMSVDEIKREQRVKTEALERESMLRTKAMREKDELKSAIKYYRFVLLRIRFPEQFILQGVFRPLELLSDVRQFISECLLDPSREYSLVFLKNTLFDDTANLAQCGMAPSAMLNLSWSGGEDSLGFPAEQIFKPELFCRLKSV